MSRGTAIKVAIVAALVIAAVFLRTFHLQRSHFLEARKHHAAGDLKLAVREYGTSLRFYVPLSPYTEEAARRLWRMGLEFEERGETMKARAAFSALRGSLYAARSLYTPGKDWIEKCDGRLASMQAALLLEEGRISQGEVDSARKRHLRALRADRAPSPFWSFAAWVSFAGFVASVAFTLLRGLGPDARPGKRKAAAGLAAAACAFLLWVVSLMMA
ncbi:MAG: hypothetical protein PVG55_02995 [Nitrospirota bacterium]|jgi:hypothetical protein